MRTFFTLWLLLLVGVLLVDSQPPKESSSITITDIQGDPVDCAAGSECVVTPSQQFIPRHWATADLQEM